MNFNNFFEKPRTKPSHEIKRYYYLENFERLIARCIESKERLDLREELGIMIHDMYYQFILSEDEAKDFMERLNISSGRDNQKTLEVIQDLHHIIKHSVPENY